FDEEIDPSKFCICSGSDINSVCRRGRCECKPGFAPDHMGNCEKVLGMDCNHDLDCASYVYGSHCVLDEPFGTVCKCKPGWYERNFECSPCHCLCDGNGNCTNSGDDRAYVYCTCEPASRTAAASEGKRDNMGKRFVLSFFGNALLSSFTCTDDKKDVRLMLKMTSYSDTPADVRVSTPLHPDYPPVSVSVQKGKETTVSMPRALFKSNATGFATDSILVESSRDIAVFGLEEGPGFSGGYLALPVDVLGQEYVALCSIDSRHSDDYSQHSEIIIIAVENDTRVRITMPKVEGVFVLYNGSEFTRHRMLEIRLSKYETFHIHSKAFSLTQTFINSDRPIAVISGAREQYGSTKDIVLEMMPPMSAWGRMYTISPRHSEDSNNWTLVILSSRSEQSYVVAQGNNQPTLSETLERHVTYETYAQSLLTITALEHDPILVGVHTSCRHHFQDGTTTGGLDTAVATPFEQTPKNVTFVSAGSRLNGVSMISISYCLKTLMLDGGQVHWNSDLSIRTPMLQLNATTANVDRGTHYISNDQPQEGVLVSVYGYGDNVGHAFPAGALYTITHPCHPSITVAWGFS
ncbi:uncharacterized protein LOC106166783, partial [Lingula anatina]|uniref:Uncharacterized protein LOC106166783 n=1 Tax=Lingula anatina TaxID=7574 RepID=A0A1S3ITN9_LINAN